MPTAIAPPAHADFDLLDMFDSDWAVDPGAVADIASLACATGLENSLANGPASSSPTPRG